MAREGYIDTTSDTDTAAPIGCSPEQVKRQAVQMRIEGASISAAVRVVGASVPSVSGWVKRGR